MTIDGFRISATSNLGVSHIVSVIDLESARAVAKTLRVVENHMVWIEDANERLERWDRAHVKGSNRWRKVDPDSFETLGRIIEVSITRSQNFEVPR
jgi:hypothetical protein